jgi:hypothetical protein
VGERVPFTDVAFFWSQHYGISIHYVGPGERWEAIDVDGNLEKHDGMVRCRDAGRLVAVASLSSDRESLEAELAMAHDGTAV